MSATFEELEVWKKSCRLTIRLYSLLRDCRDYRMKDQMLRASVSIPSTIAEGRERNGVPDLLKNRKLTTVDGYKYYSTL